jgi:hypothetical protein
VVTAFVIAHEHRINKLVVRHRCLHMNIKIAIRRSVKVDVFKFLFRTKILNFSLHIYKRSVQRLHTVYDNVWWSVVGWSVLLCCTIKWSIENVEHCNGRLCGKLRKRKTCKHVQRARNTATCSIQTVSCGKQIICIKVETHFSRQTTQFGWV